MSRKELLSIASQSVGRIVPPRALDYAIEAGIVPPVNRYMSGRFAIYEKRHLKALVEHCKRVDVKRNKRIVAKA